MSTGVGCLVLVGLLVAFVAIRHNNSPPPSNTAPADNPSPTTTPHNSQLTHTDEATEDHELHLLPNLFGRGAVSDGRTYSIALISAYQSKIPPATGLFVQGIILGQAGQYAITMTDEQDRGKSLVCDMSPEEFQDVTFLYHAGDRVQAEGLYENASDGIPLLRNCRVASPTDKVVRLGTMRASIGPDTAIESTPSPRQPVVPGDQITPNNVASIREAAERGDADAQSKLGMMYHNGQGVPQDDAEAAGWWRRAAEQGYAPAQNGLGASYRDGRGVPQDYAQAVYWCRKAAEQGYAKAQNNLGLSYALGQGVRQDYAQAAVWYRKAAEQGFVNAQAPLGILYSSGYGVPQDYAQAYFWLDLAISTGKFEEAKKEDAVKLRDDAASHLSPAELSQGQERVRKWLEEHPPKVE